MTRRTRKNNDGCSVDKAKAGGSKTDRPLEGRVVYLDLPGQRAVDKFENNLKLLGAVIEKCFSKDVKILITNRGHRKDYCPAKKAAGEGTGGGAPVPSPFSMGSVKSVCSPAAESPATGDTVSRPFTRGKAIASKVNLTKHFGTTNVVEMARQWKIKTVHIDQIRSWVEQQIEKLPSHSQSKMNDSKHRKHKVKPLSKSFIKFEAINKHYRPLHGSFDSFPQPNMESSHGSCPFEPHHTKGQSEVIERASERGEERDTRGGWPDERHYKENVGVRQSPRNSMKASGLRNVEKRLLTAGELRRLEREHAKAGKRGYCELCEAKYDSITKHVRCDSHRRFVNKKENFSRLDHVIAQDGHGLDAFLARQRSGTSCHDDDYSDVNDEVILLSSYDSSSVKTSRQQCLPAKASPPKPTHPPSASKKKTPQRKHKEMPGKMTKLKEIKRSGAVYKLSTLFETDDSTVMTSPSKATYSKRARQVPANHRLAVQKPANQKLEIVELSSEVSTNSSCASEEISFSESSLMPITQDGSNKSNNALDLKSPAKKDSCLQVSCASVNSKCESELSSLKTRGVPVVLLRNVLKDPTITPSLSLSSKLYKTPFDSNQASLTEMSDEPVSNHPPAKLPVTNLIYGHLTLSNLAQVDREMQVSTEQDFLLNCREVLSHDYNGEEIVTGSSDDKTIVPDEGHRSSGKEPINILTKTTLKLNQSWSVLSDRSMQKLLDMKDKDEVEGFAGFGDKHNGDELPSDLSYEEVSEVEVTCAKSPPADGKTELDSAAPVKDILNLHKLIRQLDTESSDGAKGSSQCGEINLLGEGTDLDRRSEHSSEWDTHVSSYMESLCDKSLRRSPRKHAGSSLLTRVLSPFHKKLPSSPVTRSSMNTCQAGSTNAGFSQSQELSDSIQDVRSPRRKRLCFGIESQRNVSEDGSLNFKPLTNDNDDSLTCPNVSGSVDNDSSIKHNRNQSYLVDRLKVSEAEEVLTFSRSQERILREMLAQEQVKPAEQTVCEFSPNAHSTPFKPIPTNKENMPKSPLRTTQSTDRVEEDLVVSDAPEILGVCNVGDNTEFNLKGSTSQSPQKSSHVSKAVVHCGNAGSPTSQQEKKVPKKMNTSRSGMRVLRSLPIRKKMLYSYTKLKQNTVNNSCSPKSSTSQSDKREPRVSETKTVVKIQNSYSARSIELPPSSSPCQAVDGVTCRPRRSLPRPNYNE